MNNNILSPLSFPTRSGANRFATWNRCACRGILHSEQNDNGVYILRCVDCAELATAFNTQKARALQEQIGNERCTAMEVKAATNPKRSTDEILSELGF